MKACGLVYDARCMLHDQGDGHLERPERLEAIRAAIDASGLALTEIPARHATREDLLRVHTAEHVDCIERTCAEGLPYPDPDTQMGPASWEAALLAAGGAMAACDAVLEGRVTNAFCALRPPGHHAEAEFALGFCLFNNVAVAARYAQAVRGVGRVAILDWDVHHGNGTQHIFYDDPSVYYASMHEHPHYPGTGVAHERGAGGTTLNIPMAWDTPAARWLDALEREILPEFERFAPDLLLISAGFDANHRDPLGGQALTEAHFAEMTRMVKGLAGGKVVSLLEGGYNLEALAASVVAHVRALAEEEP